MRVVDLPFEPGSRRADERPSPRTSFAYDSRSAANAAALRSRMRAESSRPRHTARGARRACVQDRKDLEKALLLQFVLLEILLAPLALQPAAHALLLHRHGKRLVEIGVARHVDHLVGELVEDDRCELHVVPADHGVEDGIVEVPQCGIGGDAAPRSRRAPCRGGARRRRGRAARRSSRDTRRSRRWDSTTLSGRPRTRAPRPRSRRHRGGRRRRTSDSCRCRADATRGLRIPGSARPTRAVCAPRAACSDRRRPSRSAGVWT